MQSKEERLKTIENGITYDIFPETKTHLVKDNEGNILSNVLTKITEDATKVAQDTANVAANVAQVTSELADVKNNLTQADNKITQVSSELTTVSQSVLTNASDIAEIKAENVNISAEVSKNRENISQVTTNVSDVSLKVQTLTEETTKAKEDILTIKTENSSILEKVLKNAEDITAINAKTETFATTTSVKEQDTLTLTEAKSYTDTEISKINNLNFEIVQELPQTGKSNIIYLLSDPSSPDNLYKEYIWLDNKWEVWGSASIDLTPYATKEELTQELNSKSDATHNHNADYATKESEHAHINKDVIDAITNDDIASWNNKAENVHSHDDLYYPKTTVDEFIEPISTEYIDNLFDSLESEVVPVNFYTKEETDIKLEAINSNISEINTIIDSNVSGLGDKLNTIETNVAQNTIDITSIETDLSVTENSKYTTINGVKEFECGNGYIDNVVIEGKTLVNYFISKNITVPSNMTNNGSYTLENNGFTLKCTSGQEYYVHLYNQPLSKGKQYTVYFDLEINNGSIDIFEIGSSNNIILNNNNSSGVYKILFTPSFDSFDLRFDINSLNGIAKFKNVMILEGDYTNKSVSYFEGLKSVGQGDKIEVLSYNQDLNNSININSSMLELGDFNATGGTIDLNTMIRTKEFIDVSQYDIFKITIQNPRLILSEIAQFNGFFYDSNKIMYNNAKHEDNLVFSKYNNGLEIILNKPKNVKYIKFRVRDFDSTKVLTQDDINATVIDIGNVLQYDKKQILTTLRSLPNGVKDVVHKQGDKYYKIKRCIERTYSGNEDWGLTQSEYNSTNIIGFVCRDVSTNKYILSDKFKTIPDPINSPNPSTEYICCDANIVNAKWFVVGIEKTKLSSQDITGFKTWLKNNPLTIMYELATPIIEELPNFNPRTFNDKTTILLNSGVIQCEANFDITNSTRSELEVLKSKATSVEEGLLNNIYGFQAHKLTQDNGKNTIISNSNMNLIVEPGFYGVEGNVLNKPENSSSYFHLIALATSSNWILQIATHYSNGTTYIRTKSSGVWQPWQKVATTSTLSLMEQQISELEIQAIENEV